MQCLHKILSFYLKSNSHIALAIWSLLKITSIELNKKTTLELEIFVFFGTILGYSILKYSHLKYSIWNQFFWKGILYFNLFAFIICFYFFGS